MTENESRACDADFDDFDYGDIFGASDAGESEGEKQLWCAVILQAVFDLRNQHPKEETERKEAERWFKIAGKDFQQVCRNAGLNPSVVRNKIIKNGK